MVMTVIKMCEEGIAETAGRPDGDGIIGMSRLYFYEAVKLVLEGNPNMASALC